MTLHSIYRYQPFKGAPPDVTGQVAAHMGSLTQGVISAVGYVSRRGVFVLPTTPHRPRRKRNPTQQRRWAVRGWRERLRRFRSRRNGHRARRGAPPAVWRWPDAGASDQTGAAGAASWVPAGVCGTGPSAPCRPGRSTPRPTRGPSGGERPAIPAAGWRSSCRDRSR